MLSPLFLISTLIKTVRFNLFYFDIKTALTCPVVVSHNVWLKKMAGTVTINGEIKRASIRIGFGDIGIFDKQRSRAIWAVDGRVVFNGRADIGHSVKINVHKSGELVIGDNFIVNAETSIICRKQVSFGDNNLVSWQCMITDTDFHQLEQKGEQINPDEPIRFGDRVWIGMRTNILKGTTIADGIVIGAGSVVVGNLEQHNTVYAGNPAKPIKENISWSL
jgi:acetyltransferase-like isoleucine patch superfamily enzyme